jgi:putative cofactor-binding repeat protein
MELKAASCEHRLYFSLIFATYPHAVLHVQWNAQDFVGVGRYVLITGNTIDLAHALKASFRRSRNLAEDLEKITTQYRN